MGLGTLWLQILWEYNYFWLLLFFANFHRKANQIKGAAKGKLSEKSGSISQIRPSPW